MNNYNYEVHKPLLLGPYSSWGTLHGGRLTGHDIYQQNDVLIMVSGSFVFNWQNWRTTTWLNLEKRPCRNTIQNYLGDLSTQCLHSDGTILDYFDDQRLLHARPRSFFKRHLTDFNPVDTSQSILVSWNWTSIVLATEALHQSRISAIYIPALATGEQEVNGFEEPQLEKYRVFGAK